LFRRYALLRVVHKDLSQQIKKLLVEGRIGRDEVLEMNQYKYFERGRTMLTLRCFMAFTYFREAFDVSLLG